MHPIHFILKNLRKHYESCFIALKQRHRELSQSHNGDEVRIWTPGTRLQSTCSSPLESAGGVSISSSFLRNSAPYHSVYYSSSCFPLRIRTNVPAVPWVWTPIAIKASFDLYDSQPGLLSGRLLISTLNSRQVHSHLLRRLPIRVKNKKTGWKILVSKSSTVVEVGGGKPPAAR